jgi:chaperone required for assembly of F1-ATPase
MKRFWTEVQLAADAGGHALALDGRPVRTPGRDLLRLPTAALAEVVAEEWRAVGETLDPRAMPLTGLSNAAIDRIGPDPQAFAAGLAAYAAGDLLCYRAEGPAGLRARQDAAWDPLLDWARRRYDIHFELVEGVMPRPQPPATVTRLSDAVAALGPWQLAGLSPVVTVSGSLVAGLALLEGAASADQVWTAADVDDQWQVEKWGEDDIATRAREARQRDFAAGARFLALLG